ncbi:hypothetical protein BGZ83_003221 [Gryganskiella cystojenkinii]|nr:hypothetical protein BGZ83_003221 [Gryganskiella cystojenkinii]
MRLKTISTLIATLALAAFSSARPDLIISNDQRGLIFIGSFGFLSGGTLKLDLQDFEAPSDDRGSGDDKGIGFLIQRGPSEADTVDWEEGCILDDDYFKEELEQEKDQKLKRLEFFPVDITKATFNYEHTIEKEEEEMWSVLFVNCPRRSVSFKLKTTEVNPGDNYLSAGDIPLPKVYVAAAVAYFAASGLWASMLMKKDTKVFWPHKLIFVLAVMIGIQKTFQAIKVYYMGKGVEEEGWTVMFYIFAFIKPFLSQKDKKIILVIIPLQILSNVASTISSETAIGSINWSFWTQVFPMVDLISCIVILGVIVQTQRHLSEAAEAEGKVAENKTKYKLWGSFYLVTVVYIYLTRIMVGFLKVALPYQYVQWLVELLNEVITLGFYATIGWKFRPYANNPYTLIDEEDLDHDDIETGINGEHVGLQTMSRREGRNNEHDE